MPVQLTVSFNITPGIHRYVFEAMNESKPDTASEETDEEITVKLTATVEIYHRVDEGESHPGEHYRDADTFDYEPDQIITHESRDVTVNLAFEGGYPNLDAYAYTVYAEGGPRGRFEREIIETLGISADVSIRCDWEVSDWTINIDGSREAWKAQVVTWCSERPDESASDAIESFRSWNRYDNIRVHVPSGLSVTLPWSDDDGQPVTDGGEDTPITQAEYESQMQTIAEETVAESDNHRLENDTHGCVVESLNYDRWFTHGSVELHQKLIEHCDESPGMIRHTGDEWDDICQTAAYNCVRKSLIARVTSRIEDES